MAKGLTAEQKRNRALLQYRYKAKRKQTDEMFATLERLRDRVRQALKRYAAGKKVGSAKGYGIDYTAIALHIGPCPGNRKDYEIDHKRPLVSFDFSDPKQIEAAFAPSNHQWLLKELNRAKGGRY
jgi:hypothetical protein